MLILSINIIYVICTYYVTIYICDAHKIKKNKTRDNEQKLLNAQVTSVIV